MSSASATSGRTWSGRTRIRDAPCAVPASTAAATKSMRRVCPPSRAAPRFFTDGIAGRPGGAAGGLDILMVRTTRDELVFVPLGGVGEIGMNMGAYGFGPERSRKWLVVDCGVTFAGPSLPGIELIMADPTFLEENADDVLALVLTHSHEDHYGAVLDLWPGFDRPVYATAFTAAMLAAKRASDNIVENVSITPMRVFVTSPMRHGRTPWRTCRDISCRSWSPARGWFQYPQA